MLAVIIIIKRFWVGVLSPIEGRLSGLEYRDQQRAESCPPERG